MAAADAPATPSPQALLRKLEWRVRDVADTLLGGEYRSAFRGRGREFDQVVRYEWGDDVRDIDWNVTARLGEPYRKKFVEERELTVVLLFEDSPSLQFGSSGRSKRDTLRELAGLLALICAGNRDRAGAWIAGPHAQDVRRPVRGRGHIARTVARILARPAPALDAGPVEIDWRGLAHAFPRHTVVAWLGDFPPREKPAGWAALCRRYEMLGLRVEDPWERALPERGTFSAIDPASGTLLPLNPRSRAVRRRHAEWVAARDAAFETLFPDPVTRLTVASDGDLVDALVGFFRSRMRALRS